MSVQARSDDAVNGVDVRDQNNALRVPPNAPHLTSFGTGRLDAGTAVALQPCQGNLITIGQPNCRFNSAEEVKLMHQGLPQHQTTQYHHNEHANSGYTNHQTERHQCYQTNVQKIYKDTPLSQLDQELDMTLKEMSRKKPPVAPRKPYRDLDHSDSNSDQESRPKVSSIMAKVSKFEYYAKQQKNTGRSQFYTNNENEISPKVFSSNSLTVNTPAKDVLGGKSLPNYMNKMRQEAKIVQLSENNSIDPKNCSYANVAIRNKAKINDIVRNFDDNRLPKKVNNEQQSKDNIYGRINADGRNNFDKTQNFDARNNVGNFDDRSQNSDGRMYFDNHEVNQTQNIDFNSRNNFDNRPQNFNSRNNFGKVSQNFSERNNFNKLQTVNERSNFDYKSQHVDTRMNFEPRIVEAEMKNDMYGRINDRATNSVSPVKLSLPSPAFDRNPQYSPVYANYQIDRSLEAENMRMKAYQDRIKEEEQKEAETARLEEILNMCAEYERQISSGLPITPTEKRPHNKIITNGSLPRSVALNNPNFVQTAEGYYKFETSHNRNNSMSQSLPIQRNLSQYENLDLPQSPHSDLTPELRITHSPHNYENVGRMDEIGIPVYESPKHELSSPIMIRKIQNGDPRNYSTSPIGSPYENVYSNRNLQFKPKSPNTHSPRTRIKTTFAHKNLPSPQYFVFPTPPPVDNSKKPSFIIPNTPTNNQNVVNTNDIPNSQSPAEINEDHMRKNVNKSEKVGIEKQLSLEEEIPMIDDADLTDDIEFRYAKKVDDVEEDKKSPKTCKEEYERPSIRNEIVEEKSDKQSSLQNSSNEPKRRSLQDIIIEITDSKRKSLEKEITENKRNSLKDDLTETLTFLQKEKESERKLSKNQSFDDVKKELMADIPELEEFEKDLKENRRDKVIMHITEDMKKMDVEADSIDSVLDDNVTELRSKFEKLKEERKKLVTEIHEIKCKMTEIRSQEDDILRELEMEKALIKGEYDSEIAILNIELKKRTELMDKAKQIEEEIRSMRERQEARQKEMRDRVEIATLKVERIEKDLKMHAATLEELQNAQDILDNESKTCEDLEFQYLEEESELLSNREDLQQEINILTKKLEAQKTRILTLKSEATDNLTSALDETKILHAEYVRLLNQVEDMTSKVQAIEKELKLVASKLNDIERTQSPDSAFYTDQTRAKSGEYGYSPQSSDSDDLDLTKISNFEDHTKELKDKFNSIDRMSQSMIVDIERRVIIDVLEPESPTKSSTSKEKKGFWERNFDSLKRKKKPKSPEKTDIMSQSLNENLFYNNGNIETDSSFDKFNSLRHSKKKDKHTGPVKSSSSSKIPTFAALGKIIKKDSFGKKSRESSVTKENGTESKENSNKNRYVKNAKQTTTDNKYKSKSASPDKTNEQTIKEENEETEIRQTNNPFDVSKTIDNKDNYGKVFHRKSCGDEPSIKNNLTEFQKISDSGKIPSQDDIDRISKVTMDAPLLSSDTDMNSLGKRTLDSLMELEKKRMEMLEEQGCQVIENEREKISELKRRAQDETKKLWDQKYREQSKSLDSDHYQPSDVDSNTVSSTPGERNAVIMQAGDRNGVSLSADRGMEDSMMDNSFDMTSSGIFEDSSGLLSSSIEELQVRNSRTESTEDDRRSDDSRPLSHASDFTRENILSGGRRRPRVVSDSQRPLTRYLPNDRDDFDLRRHVESAGHQIEVCPYVTVTSTSCRGYLHKLGAKFHTWSKRWFVFDRETKTFVYYWDKSEKKPRGGAYFQVIEEVYLDHGNTSKSPSPQTTFIVKTRQRRYYLMAPSGESARIWIDVIFTGAQGYTEYLE